MGGRCRREVLAEGTACAVERCACGTIHVTLGPWSVRLAREDFEGLCALLGQAAARLRQAGPRNRIGGYFDGDAQ